MCKRVVVIPYVAMYVVYAIPSFVENKKYMWLCVYLIILLNVFYMYISRLDGKHEVDMILNFLNFLES